MIIVIAAISPPGEAARYEQGKKYAQRKRATWQSR